MPATTVAWMLAVASSAASAPPSTRVPSLHGHGDAAGTWIAYSAGALWVSWRVAKPAAADWERLPFELATGDGGSPSESWHGSPLALVLTPDTVAFASGDGRVWVYRRAGVLELAVDSGWDLAPADLAPLEPRECGPAGWVPAIVERTLSFRPDGCRDVVSCSGIGRLTAPSRHVPRVAWAISLEVWAAPGTAETWWLDGEPPRRPAILHRSAEVGLAIQLEARFDRLSRMRQIFRIHRLHKRGLNPRRPDSAHHDPLGQLETEQLRAVACGDWS
ncbi:MAG: hypothetical protein B7733_09175 [Myxococcales bacterium FL481]|nr:MAG: hypothetical protein B7733_09175 [Myxococcales bacterium FL481]